MINAKLLLIVGLASMAIFASAALGGAPMGPPMALLGEGHWGVSGEYGYENINLRASGNLRMKYGTDAPPPQNLNFIETVEIEDLTMNMFFGTLAYGVCDNWDIFVRLGVANAQDEARATATIPKNLPAGPVNPDDLVDLLGTPQQYSLGCLDSSFGFAWGVGTRATFCRSGPWAFGGLAQATWFKPGDSSIRYSDPLWGTSVEHTGDASFDFWETQVSLAVSYQVDAWRLWAGPFLQFVAGDFDRSGNIAYADVGSSDEFKGSGRLQQESEIGGHFGVDWSISQQVDLWVEGQITADSWFAGIGLIFKPQETFGM